MAHPSRGIVVGRDGKVYFSDLTRIWRLDGDRRVLIRDNRGRHTHAMIVDASGQLVWEESRYDPSSQRYTETIWQLTKDGPKVRFGPLSTPPLGLGIARDRRGCTYRVDQPVRGGEALVARRCPGRAPERLIGDAGAAAAFRPELINDVAGIAFAPDGRFLFRQGSAVRAIDSAGRVATIATGLSADNFGIAVDSRRHLLVAEFERRRVIRVGGARRDVVATSAPGWAPTGVTVGPDGRVYILEATLHRPGQPLRMQVRAIRDGRSRLLTRLTVAT